LFVKVTETDFFAGSPGSTNHQSSDALAVTSFSWYTETSTILTAKFPTSVSYAGLQSEPDEDFRRL